MFRGDLLREIGGYIELDTYSLPMLHEKALALNCGRNAFAFILLARNIKKIVLPYFLCESVRQVCKRYDVEVRYYHINEQFLPTSIHLAEDEWMYVVNYYGQLSNQQIHILHEQYHRIIMDNAQAYFNSPMHGIDTFYSCRKYFGVSDGSFLYSDVNFEKEYPQDESYKRMSFLLGRFERTASEFYLEYAQNNTMFESEPIKQMSKLTWNLLHGIDYDNVRDKRTENFRYLHEKLQKYNKLELFVPDGAFMYPLYINGGAIIRKKLQKKKIYIPTLWPDVFDVCDKTMLEYDMAENILPLPVDQRYGLDDMEYICENLKNSMIENV